MKERKRLASVKYVKIRGDGRMENVILIVCGIGTMVGAVISGVTGNPGIFGVTLALGVGAIWRL